MSGEFLSESRSLIILNCRCPFGQSSWIDVNCFEAECGRNDCVNMSSWVWQRILCHDVLAHEVTTSVLSWEFLSECIKET